MRLPGSPRSCSIVSSRDPSDANAYRRRCRDDLFRTHPQSPLPADERARFASLRYFDYDPRFAFTAAIRPLREPSEILRVSGLTAGFLLEASRRMLEHFRSGENSYARWYTENVRHRFRKVMGIDKPEQEAGAEA